MYPRWTHWRDLKGICSICGEPAHVGTSKRTGRHFWLHDKYDMYEYYNSHGVQGLAEIERGEFFKLLREAEKRGIEVRATHGGTEAVSKRVKCIETDEEYPSIQAAADAVGRNRASLSAAVKRHGTCGGFHWGLA